MTIHSQNFISNRATVSQSEPKGMIITGLRWRWMRITYPIYRNKNRIVFHKWNKVRSIRFRVSIFHFRKIDIIEARNFIEIFFKNFLEIQKKYVPLYSSWSSKSIWQAFSLLVISFSVINYVVSMRFPRVMRRSLIFLHIGHPFSILIQF